MYRILRVPIVCLLLGASGVAFGSNFREITSGADLMLCKGAQQYQSSLGESSTRYTVTYKNDFPFNIELIHWSESAWAKSPVVQGGEISLTLAPNSVVLAVDPSIGMCVGALTASQTAWGISLGEVLADFDGEKLLAQQQTPQKSYKARSAECYSGYTALDLGVGLAGQKNTIDEMVACLEEVPDGTSVPLSGNPSVLTLAASNAAGLKNLSLAVESAAQCDLMDKAEAEKHEDTLATSVVAMAYLQHLAGEAIEKGLTHWVKGRDDYWEAYVKAVVMASVAADETMQDFERVMEKPEFNGPCMCDKLPVSC